MNKTVVFIITILTFSMIFPAGCSTVASPTRSSSPPPTQVKPAYTPTTPPTTTARTTTPTPSPTITTTLPSTLATKTPPPTTTAPAVPAQYQSLYNQLQGYLNEADKKVSAGWDGSSYAVGYAAELLTADGNAGPGILQASTQQVMLEELDCERLMGVKAITVQIGFPIFDPNFYLSTGQTAAQAQQSVQTWLSYYQSVAEAIHNRGLKMIVESNPLLALYISSNSTFNPGGYYKTLDFTTYQERRSQHNIIVARDIKPDYLLLQTEPQTDAVNDFRTEMTNATKDTAMIRKFVTDLESAGIPGLHTSLQLGSGTGAWQTDWQALTSGLISIPGLDKIDTHVYNIMPDVNQIGEVAIAMQIADMAHAADKGVTMSEFWLHKSTALVGFAEGADSLVDIRARDMFSFWAPLDEQFLQMVGKLANSKHFDYVSGFGFYYWFALTDYNTLPSYPVYPPANSTQNAVIDGQITTMQNLAAKQALAKQELSPTGKAYQAVIKNGPAR